MQDNGPKMFMEEEAMAFAAQCWRDPDTSHLVFDNNLARSIASRISAWMEDAARAQAGIDYYRGLVIRCGEALGAEAKTADDGGIHDTVLCAKVPELVEALCKRHEARV
jgi:hypothetical protein